MRSLFRVAHPPATPTELNTLRLAVGELPAQYVAFLAEARSVESCLHDRDGDCLTFWAPSEIPELNDAYQIPQWAPELLLIGSDGGDDGIAFDRAASTEPESWPLVRIGFGNLDRKDFVRIADSFRNWSTNEFRLVPHPA